MLSRLWWKIGQACRSCLDIGKLHSNLEEPVVGADDEVGVSDSRGQVDTYALIPASDLALASSARLTDWPR